MDLSDYSVAQLDELAIRLFDELGARKHRAKILARLTPDGLKNLGLSILEELGKRHSVASSSDKQLWEEALSEFIQRLFPDLVLAFRQKHQLIRLGQAILERAGPLLREGVAP